MTCQKRLMSMSSLIEKTCARAWSSCAYKEFQEKKTQRLGLIVRKNAAKSRRVRRTLINERDHGAYRSMGERIDSFCCQQDMRSD
mmetsp:Transcript_47762/g.120239  ORF Transcript_47762/g.120239 Transcript_47762/m.120239 type:complete len:85 (+) Transcript_47762:726-980(+)